MAIKAILFDVIGTTVLETNPLLINQCFERSFSEYNIQVPGELIQAIRGKDKKEAITSILQQLNSPLHLADQILAAFKKHFLSNLNSFRKADELKGTISFLRSRNIKIGIGTGLSDDIFQPIFEKLNWSSYQFDYIGIAEKIGRGRPHPDMIFDMIKKLGIAHSEFLKVGDTPADIQEGKNASVLTAAILSGTTRKSDFIKLKPDFIITSLTDLIKIVDSQSNTR